MGIDRIIKTLKEHGNCAVNDIPDLNRLEKELQVKIHCRASYDKKGYVLEIIKEVR